MQKNACWLDVQKGSNYTSCGTLKNTNFLFAEMSNLMRVPFHVRQWKMKKCSYNKDITISVLDTGGYQMVIEMLEEGQSRIINDNIYL